MKEKLGIFLLCAALLGGCAGRGKDAAKDTSAVSGSEGADSGNSGGASLSAEAETEKAQAEADFSDGSADTVTLGEPFSEAFVSEGTLTYTVVDCQTYSDLSSCSLTREDFSEFENIYEDPELLKQYSDLDNIIDADGAILPEFRFVLLTVDIQNTDAVGLTMKNVFNLSSIGLADRSSKNLYHICYFSEAADTPVEGDPLYYTLEQGKDMQVKIGFLVLTEELEASQIVGTYRDTVIDVGL